MKKLFCVFFATLLVLGLAVSAYAHTGPLVNGEPAWGEVDISSLATTQSTHDETINNPLNSYKGWWFVNLTNSTNAAWSSVAITTPGTSNMVAIVQGDGLADEWGFTANSVSVNKAGTASYSGSLGSRLYENGVTGQLWSQFQYTFTTPVAVGQKAGFRVYTDNSYYQGPYASSFILSITPNAAPEPSSVLALSSGLLGMAGFVIRRRR